MIKKITGIFIYFISILVFLLALLISASYIFRDSISSLFISEINKRLLTEIKVNSVDFSLVKKFPYASIEFNEIYSLSSRNYEHSAVNSSNDTLFKLKSLFLEFSIYELLSKNYRISKIHALEGNINIARDRLGHYNYLIWKNSPKTDTAKFELNLQNIRLSDVVVSYTDLKSLSQFRLDMQNCQVKCRLSSSLNHFSTSFNGKILKFQMDSLELFSNKEIFGAIDLKSTADQLIISSPGLTVNQARFIAAGIYDYKDIRRTNYNLKCEKINIENTLVLLPERWKASYLNLNLRGNLSINTFIKYNSQKQAELDINFKPVKSSVSFEYKKIKLSALDFNGSLFTQLTDSAGISKISINNINGIIDSEPFQGSFSAIKSAGISFKLKWQGKSNLLTLNKLITNDTLKYFTGNFGGRLEIDGRLKNIDSLNNYDFAHFDYEGDLQLDNIKILKPEILLGISDLSGKFKIKKDIIVESSNITYKDNELTGSGQISNFLPWLLTKDETLKIQGEIQSDSFMLDKVIANNTTSKNESTITHFPDYLLLELDVKFREFVSHKFKASKVAGKINYKPKLFDLRSLYFETMEGNLTGSALLLQKPDNNFIFRTQVLLDKINISYLFSTFNNFGQSLIDYKNIKGKISGLTNLSSELSNSFSILSPSVLVDGTVKIENGELIDYEPLNGLSKYINVEELKHIYFTTLQNDIIIKNRVITIPQMDIKSANFDIVGSGTHDFDNNFNYKINVLLSEALYSRAKKTKNQMDEYGVIETEGNRKISLPLTIKGNIDNYKVSYDAKRAAVNMIQNLKNEKKQIKTLLNEEFGFFKKDSLSRNVKEIKKEKPVAIEFDDENYQGGKKTEKPVKTNKTKEKEIGKDSTKIKIDFQ